MPDASPTKWHLAHTTWFFETFVLAPHVPGYKPYDARWGFLFNSYYNALGPRHARSLRGVLSRPSRREVDAYRRAIDEQVAALLSTASPAFSALVTLGLHHEQQHQELILTDMQHALSLNPLKPALRAAPPNLNAKAARPAWHAFDGGLFELGHQGGGFSFDNELPVHQVYLQPFALSTQLVTAGEFADFVADGGYERPELWLSDGWAVRQREGWRAPLYWQERDHQWWRYSLHGEQLVARDEPVCHVSYYEADAFARWADARLPTEAEWETAARRQGTVTGQFATGETLIPIADTSLYGSAWVWTQSAYAAYPGFRAGEGAIGEYNGKFMCNQLVLRGGSCFTPLGHVRPSYRNFFYPDTRWQVSGIRLARDGKGERK
jgi:ergothioneine biosynthesis protein EgtB